MEAVVWYTVPVGVHVDTDTGEVTRVVTIDESVALDESTGVRDTAFLDSIPEDVKRRAIEIAESGGSGGWPAWEYGY